MVEALMLELCRVHMDDPKTLAGARLNRWAAVMRDYRLIQDNVVNCPALMAGTRIQLYEVNQRTLSMWHNQRIKDMMRDPVALAVPGPNKTPNTYNDFIGQKVKNSDPKIGKTPDIMLYPISEIRSGGRSGNGWIIDAAFTWPCEDMSWLRCCLGLSVPGQHIFLQHPHLGHSSHLLLPEPSHKAVAEQRKNTPKINTHTHTHTHKHNTYVQLSWSRAPYRDL